MLFVGRYKQNMTRRHVNGLSGSAEASAARRDDVDLVLFMWLLWILGSGRNAVRPQAQGWHAQVLAVLRSALCFKLSNICQVLHRADLTVAFIVGGIGRAALNVPSF
jgi:hypothetical protein